LGRLDGIGGGVAAMPGIREVPRGAVGKIAGRRGWLLTVLAVALAGCQAVPTRATTSDVAAPAAPGRVAQVAPSGPPEPLRIVFSLPGRQLYQLSPLLAEDQGFFRVEGLDPTLIVMAERERLGGLLSGEVGYDGGIGSTLFLAARTGELRVAMFLHGRAPWRLLGQPDIPDVAALRGGRVMVSSPGSAGNLLARTALRRAGLDPERDVELMISSSETGRQAALETEQVQAANVAVPFDSMMVRRGHTILADALEMNLDLPITGVTVTPARLASNADEVRRVLRAILRAQQFIREQRDETLEFAARAFEIDRELLAGELDRLVSTYAPDGELTDAQLRRFFELNLGAGVDLGVRLEDVRYGELYDYTALRAARRELGR
jgi:ABC-type nitrate/sulfonate/bicarbonate transport system substrate-binding protein